MNKNLNFPKFIITSLCLFSLAACQDVFVAERLTTPRVEKISTTNYTSLSEKTYNSYIAFARKFTTLMMEENNTNNEQSLGISIPDAYLCLAIVGVTSTEKACKDVLDYLELSSISELRVAVKEILKCFATLFKNSNGKLVGGYNLNSIWFDPENVTLIKEKDEELYKDLEEVFDASIFMEPLTSKKANDYLKAEGLKDMPTPEIKLQDEDPCLLNVMSVYYCLDYFEEATKNIYKNQYNSGKHKMDYYLGNSSRKVDYIETIQTQNVYENTNFYGSSLDINFLNMAFFIPKEKEMMPSEILSDVLNENYSLKNGRFKDYEGNSLDTDLFNVHISAPYFSLDNSCELDGGVLSDLFPNLTSAGASERLVKPKVGSLFLDYIKQFSVMKFNYDGFYSCSVTIAGERGTSTGIQYENFDLTLDHPYIFEVRKRVSTGSTRLKEVPLIVGEIVEPSYKE